METIWLKSYPPGVPAEIDPSVYASLVDLFERSVARFADLPAFTHMGRTLTFREVDRLSAAFASFLQHDLGLEPGARVALMLPNVLQYPVAMFGILRAGGVVVNVNPLYTAREVSHQLRDAGAEAIVVLENFAHTLDEVPEVRSMKAVVVASLGEMLGAPRSWAVDFVVRRVKKMVPPWRLPGHRRWNEVLRRGAERPMMRVESGLEDIAFLQYTGGTTGVAKGAVLLHRNLIANVLQASAWVASVLREGQERVVTALPLYHIFALTANCLVFFRLGGHNPLITNPRDLDGLVRELARWPFTAITGVNTLFNALVHHPGFAKLDFSPLKLTLGGGMAVQQAVAQKWQKLTGRPLLEAYGLTETSPAVTINPLDLPAFNHSIGLPLPSTDVSLRDDAGAEVPLGEAGELCVRGPQVMREYWNRPDETAKVFFPDGFLRTGDVARMDERGFLYIVDRKKDMILVSGFNVYPNEVEDVIALHPGVLEVAVVGVPDERSGEAVKAYVVRRDPALDAEAIRQWCHERLTPYKVPHHVEFREELPKTQVGKILRRALRAKAQRQG
ncbi:MAG: AMP-binding protein [Rhodocyclales bacterium]|nr:AMP-binding protein [Rhodocyclales bacterium]